MVKEIIEHIRIQLCGASGKISRIHFDAVSKGRSCGRGNGRIGAAKVRGDDTGAGSRKLQVGIYICIIFIYRMVVNAGHFRSDKIRNIGVQLLGIHQYNIVLRNHFRDIRTGLHGDAKGIQHFPGTEPVDAPIVAEGGGDSVVLQKFLEREGAGNSVRVWKVVGLNIDGVVF